MYGVREDGGEEHETMADGTSVFVSGWCRQCVTKKTIEKLPPNLQTLVLKYSQNFYYLYFKKHLLLI